VVLVFSALGIPQAQPAVLGALGPGETVVLGPGPVGKATLLARIGESAWPTLLQAATTIPFYPKPMTRRSGPGISQLRGGSLG
jgi:hypothetical protein